MFDKKNSRNYHQVPPYVKPPVTMELKVRGTFLAPKLEYFQKPSSSKILKFQTIILCH